MFSPCQSHGPPSAPWSTVDRGTLHVGLCMCTQTHSGLRAWLGRTCLHAHMLAQHAVGPFGPRFTDHIFGLLTVGFLRIWASLLLWVEFEVPNPNCFAIYKLVSSGMVHLADNTECWVIGVGMVWVKSSDGSVVTSRMYFISLIWRKIWFCWVACCRRGIEYVQKMKLCAFERNFIKFERWSCHLILTYTTYEEP